ncbi:mCG1041253, isoform CRA_b [Mus musculus]|nr:mCG1041253, isoform CRA_b [Mus musculus]
MRVVGMYHGGRVMAAGSWNRTLSKNTFNYKQKSRRTESDNWNLESQGRLWRGCEQMAAEDS